MRANRLFMIRFGGDLKGERNIRQLLLPLFLFILLCVKPDLMGLSFYSNAAGITSGDFLPGPEIEFIGERKNKQ